jgi:hypothetical protein
MNKKQVDEKDLVERFMKDLGCAEFSLEIRDKPDIIAVIDGCRIGIEQTTYHSDEHDGCPGSFLRSTTEKCAADSPQKPYTIAINLDRARSRMKCNTYGPMGPEVVEYGRKVQSVECG